MEKHVGGGGGGVKKKKANEKIDEGISFQEHNQEFASQFVQLLMGFALWLGLPEPDSYCWVILKRLKDNVWCKHPNKDLSIIGCLFLAYEQRNDVKWVVRAKFPHF